jgi:hypothetical protein
MKFLLLNLITHQPDLITGELHSPAERLRDVVEKAVLARSSTKSAGITSSWATRSCI